MTLALHRGLRPQRTTRRPLAAAGLLGTWLTGLLLGLATAPAQAQFNGPPGGVVSMEMNRPAVITTDPAILYPNVHMNALLAGDTLSIRLYGDPDYTLSARIDRDGAAQLPLMGDVHLAGLNIGQAEQLIGEKLVALGMYRDPQVIIQVEDGPSQVITVFGETRGVLPVKGGNRRLLEILAQAGGIGSSVSHIVTIDRPGLAEPIVIDIGTDPMRSAQANIPVLAGDTIITSRVGLVYIMGGFKATGTVPLTTYGPLTLLELTAMEGGSVQWASEKNHLHIIRTVGNRRVVSTFDIKKILKGQAPDPILQPNDIVYLPISPLKAFFANGTLGQIVGYLSLGISIAAFH